MRTALVLLLLLAAASVVGSLIPQHGVADPRIAAMELDHPLRHDIYESLGFFDVYGSVWFTLIYGLLLVSLVACLFPRTRALLRSIRSRPQPVHELDGFRHYAEREVAADPARAIARARRVLRRRFFRVSKTNGATRALAAEKGIAREAGSLIFHWSFFLILIGIALGKGTGFAGNAVIVEGDTWTEAHANYDGNIVEGRFFNEAHTGLQLDVRDFQVTYRDGGSAEDFVTRGEVTVPGNRAEPVEISVNHPAAVGGVKLYQFGFGWAPIVEVRDGSELIASRPVPFSQLAPPRGADPRALPWNGVVRLPSLRPQVGIELSLWPDSSALVQFLETGESSPMLRPVDPVMTYVVYRGALRLKSVETSNELDKSALQVWKRGAVGLGGSEEIGNGLTISFPELREYTVLHVSRDRGVMIMLVAAVLVLAGLIAALYSSRRKLWVQAEPVATGTVLKVGGFALQRRMQFEEEFSRLVDELAGGSEERAGIR
ncbi:MAG: cytochrome c biogenesis protein ResB [Actinomycetota bacterium]